MKGRWLIVMLAVLLCAGGVLLWKYGGRLFRDGDVSETYLKYKDVPGVDATFVKDFAINDSVCVDVTILEATNEDGWADLVSTYSIRQITEYPEHVKKMILNGVDAVGARFFPAGQPDIQIPIDEIDDIDIAITYNKRRTIYVFHSHTEERSRIVLKNRFYKHFDKIK